MIGSETINVRQAATVVLARDAAHGIEVFMLQRNPRSVFAAGCYVFPGGALDDRDINPGIASVCTGLSDEEASARIGITTGGLAYWHAAIRECFEEAGVLLAVDKQGLPFSASDTDTKERFTAYRTAVYEGKTELHDICDTEGLRLAAGAIDYFSHWITPEGGPRRFDTRFFVGTVPPDQEAHHDESETVAHLWISPEEALSRNTDGRLALMRPTIATLKTFSGIRCIEELMLMVRDKRNRQAVVDGNAAEMTARMHRQLAITTTSSRHIKE